MRAAGVRRFSGSVEVLELPGPRALRPDEVLIDVRACGVGNWDEFARTGDWDLGARPPMALGAEAAGLVAAVGDQVAGVKAGDRVTAHSVPLREEGAWAEQYVAASGHVAVLPAAVPFDAAAALPVPALTADQAIGDALEVRAGQTVLVHGAGGVTGGMLVQLAAHRGATVIATAGADSAGRVAAMGASTVLDYHRPDLARAGAPADRRRRRCGGQRGTRGLRRGGAGGAGQRRTGHDHRGPAGRRKGHHHAGGAGRPRGRRLGALVQLLAQGVLTVSVGDRFPLERAAAALAHARHGAHGSAIVLRTGNPG